MAFLGGVDCTNMERNVATGININIDAVIEWVTLLGLYLVRGMDGCRRPSCRSGVGASFQKGDVLSDIVLSWSGRTCCFPGSAQLYAGGKKSFAPTCAMLPFHSCRMPFVEKNVNCGKVECR